MLSFWDRKPSWSWRISLDVACLASVLTSARIQLEAGVVRERRFSRTSKMSTLRF